MIGESEAANVIKKAWSGISTISHIKSGAYGAVYKVEENVREGVVQEYAIKVVAVPDDAEEWEVLKLTGMDDNAIRNSYRNEIEKYESEIEAMCRLENHRNIVLIHDSKMIEENKRFYLLIKMELLTPLYSYLKKTGEMTENDVIKLGLDICNALIFIHQNDIFHRDIKPANILVDESKGGFLLGDFGVAKTNVIKATHLTKRVGTEGYCAPEVISGAVYDNKADIYSLGIVLYELINGNLLPFFNSGTVVSNEEKTMAIALRMSGKKPLPTPQHASKEFSEIILKACAFDPKERYASAVALKKDLQLLFEGKYRFGQNKNEASNIAHENKSDAFDSQENYRGTLKASLETRINNEQKGKTVSNRKRNNKSNNKSAEKMNSALKPLVLKVAILVISCLSAVATLFGFICYAGTGVGRDISLYLLVSMLLIELIIIVVFIINYPRKAGKLWPMYIGIVLGVVVFIISGFYPRFKVLEEKCDVSLERVYGGIIKTPEGLHQYSDGSIYIGDWKLGTRSGKGTCYWSDSGCYYEGQWKNDKREGYGVYTWSDGTVYEGDWVKNQRTGSGKTTWTNGAYYEGDFVDNKRTGNGTYRSVDGWIYTGEFVDGKCEGKGTVVYRDGTIITGVFSNDELVERD